MKLYGVLWAMALSLNACLDQPPYNAIQANGGINSIESANQAVVGIYSKFKSSALYSGYLTLLPDIQTDLVQAVQGYTNTHGDIWRWNDILSTNSSIAAVYAELYSVIGRCNYFFQEVAKLEPTLKDDKQLDKLQWYKGEAHFARALAYSELVKLYCKAYESDESASEELGVVLVDTYGRDQSIPLRRASLKESYDFILADLTKAANHLALDEDNVDIQYNATYFTQGVVHALFARLYLYMRKWDKAVEYSGKVIDSGNYLLSSASTRYTSSDSYYTYMWNYDSSTEIIWKIAFDISSYGGALGRLFLNYDHSNYYPDYVPANPILNKYDNADYRYHAFFANAVTGYPHKLTCPLLIKYKGNVNFLANNILFVNMPKVFRLSEQYLIRAEAYCELSNYSLAAKDITAIRKARYSTYGTATNLNAANWFEVVSDERIKELYMEGFRLHDLKRWNRGFTRVSQEHTVTPGNTLSVPAGDARFVWPIPQHELTTPGNEIEGNESNK